MTLVSAALPLRIIALRLACVWLGMCAILAAVVCVALPTLGTSCIVLGSCAIVMPLWTSADRSGPSAVLHALCSVLAALAAFGWCASRCGSYAAYAYFLGLPTSIIACLLHGAIAVLLVANQRFPHRFEGMATGAVAAAIGASLFFATLQIRLGIWCSACAAIHALMAVQAIALIREHPGIRRAAAVLGIFAAAGLVNAVYHHAPPPASPDDPQELLAYLRSAWTAPDPPQRIEVRDTDAAAVRRAGAAIALRLAAAAAAARSDAPRTSPPIQHPTPPAQSTAVRMHADSRTGQTSSSRTAADANRWGSPEAAITLLVRLDPGCPVCARQFAQLLELEDLVSAHELQVRFLICYRNDASQASASLAYVGGLVSEQAMLAVLSAAFRHQNDILVPADAVATLPASLPQSRALDLLRRHRDDISALLADAQRTAERLGSTGDPTLWLLSGGDASPRQHFDGLTLADVLRAAIAGLAHEPR